jgi:signal transduction histidine kinase
MLQIKHELRNIFGIIMGNCQLGAIDPTPKQMARINHAAGRAFALMESHSIDDEKLDFTQPIYINVTATEVSEMLRSVFVRTDKVRLTLDLSPDLPAVEGHPSWMFQSILNLCLNARDAIIEKSSSGGALKIITRAECGVVVISVADTGKGMSAQRLRTLWKARISADQKHGHGLQIVKTTVDRMRGKIAVQSKVGVGTTFTLSLPAMAG